MSVRRMQKQESHAQAPSTSGSRIGVCLSGCQSGIGREHHAANLVWHAGHFDALGQLEQDFFGPSEPWPQNLNYVQVIQTVPTL